MCSTLMKIMSRRLLTKRRNGLDEEAVKRSTVSVMRLLQAVQAKTALLHMTDEPPPTPFKLQHCAVPKVIT